MITGKQCRAARAMLGWSLSDLSKCSDVNRGVISKFENQSTDLRKSTAEKLLRTFSNANIELVDDIGIIQKQDTVELLRGSDCLEQLWINILNTLGSNGGEILITNVDEKRTLESGQGDLVGYLEKLKAQNITERLLSCKGDYCFLMPKECYRWLSEDVFSMGTSTYIYADKVAHQLWGDNIIILTHSEEANLAEKKRFEYMWERAEIPPRQQF